MKTKAYCSSLWTSIGLYAAIGCSLAACASGDLSDLETYTAEVLSRKGGAIPPLPEMKPYERYLYRSADTGARDPFQSVRQSQRALRGERQVSEAQKKYLQEIESHTPEELENFELDSLRMMGTLQNSKDLWGIVIDRDGTVHRVKVGSYMGRNYGKITSIAEDRIDLREIVSDDQGGWDERQASVALSEER